MSQKFPTSSFAYAHDLEPELAKKMVKCFYDYRYTPEMQKAFDGADRFFPVTFQKDWEVVRKVAEGSGEAFNRSNYDKQTAKEAEAAKKKAPEAKKP
jgi:phosphonate transport system substrate-binding protein